MPIDREAVLEIYDRLIAAHAGLSRKGAKMPYTAMNGNMFTFVDPDGVMALRFSDADLDAFRAAFDVGEVRQYGAVMRGYAPVPEALFADPAALAAWFARSVANAKTLKPKPTKKPK